jgi:hypothetical protein
MTSTKESHTDIEAVSHASEDTKTVVNAQYASNLKDKSTSSSSENEDSDNRSEDDNSKRSNLSRQEAIENFYKQSELSVKKHHRDPTASRWKPWQSWTPFRTRKTAFGVFSSCCVLTVRLLLDREPMAYLIHSIVIFVDMFLIHMFTDSVWLSVSGEILTMLFVLAFHVTKETVYELLETTLIAALCSFHMILSRNKHQDRVAHLENCIEQLKHSSIFLLQNLEIVEEERIHRWEEEAWMLNQSLARGVLAASKPHDKDIAPLHVCGSKFFEHFLDGSAGVMYTSFLGLIINELLFYGESKK